MDIRTISIEEIGLSVRSLNALRRAEVFTVGDMLQYTEETLMQIRNLGRKSVQEILEKIAKYSQYVEAGIVPSGFEEQPSNAIIPEEWVFAEENRERILTYFQEKGFDIEELELLSVKAYNLLQLNDYEKINQILFLSKESLLEIPRMEAQLAEEIQKLCSHFLKENAEEICTALLREQPEGLSLAVIMQQEEYKEIITAYAKANDWELEKTNLSNRAKNPLMRNNYFYMSQILFLSKEELRNIPRMGEGSAIEVLELIKKYLMKHEARLIAVCSGDPSQTTLALWEIFSFAMLDLSKRNRWDGTY